MSAKCQKQLRSCRATSLLDSGTSSSTPGSGSLDTLQVCRLGVAGGKLVSTMPATELYIRAAMDKYENERPGLRTPAAGRHFLSFELTPAETSRSFLHVRKLKLPRCSERYVMTSDADRLPSTLCSETLGIAELLAVVADFRCRQKIRLKTRRVILPTCTGQV